MDSAFETRSILLKEFQRCGYQCEILKSGLCIFRVKGKNDNNIYIEKLRFLVHSIVFNLVVKKEDFFQNKEVVKQYNVVISRENLIEDFKINVIAVLVNDGYIDEIIKPIDFIEYGEKELEEFFYVSLNEVLKEKNIYTLPQEIDGFNTSIEYIESCQYGIEYRFSYNVIMRKESVIGVKKRVDFYSDIPMNKLKEKLADTIVYLKAGGFIEEKTKDMFFDELCVELKSNFSQEYLRTFFDKIYNKGKEDGCALATRLILEPTFKIE